ncbi:MAG TPA: hypothetical protein PKK00_13065 [Bacteroidales bacterium]|nr:hypothetical protein [Bacteroidales bacterium]HPS18166.1 hypothetical protein [Bacteroidales bacterium]
MKSKLFFLITLIFIVSACRNNKSSDKNSFSTAVAYNDFIVDQQKLILGKHDAWNAAFTNKNVQEAKIKLDELTKQCKIAIDTISKIDAFNKNTEFRDAAIRLFTLYKNTAEGGFKEETEILMKSEISDQDEERVNQIEDEFFNTEKEIYNAFIKAQGKFASENNMVLKQ